jgi:rare lipoprotein A
VGEVHTDVGGEVLLSVLSKTYVFHILNQPFTALSNHEGGETQRMHIYIRQRRLSLCGPLAIALSFSLGACSWITKGDAQLDVGIKDRGVASWYGEQFHGRQAANGEIFNMEALTAAHRTMPLGSVVRVINVTNGKHLYVRITDRGPYEKGRILDLSRGAAAQLGMEHGGLTHVQIEIVGERYPELILLSEKTSGKASSLVVDAGSSSKPPVPSLAFPLRSLLGDIWVAMRSRRDPAVQSADNTLLPESPALVLN